MVNKAKTEKIKKSALPYIQKNYQLLSELDGVGPVDNRPSTN